MYYIIYPFLYLLSLLPWRVLYFLSDGIYGLVYYVFGYRRDVVIKNLGIAFPEKTEKERLRIARQFYHNLIDTFIEMVKLLSVSNTALAKRYSSNAEDLNVLYDTGKNIHALSGHFFNIEIVNLGQAKASKYPFAGVYMPITNKAFNRIVYNLRSRNGTILIPAVDFKTSFHKYVHGRYLLGLAADQNPGDPTTAHWIKFFGRYTPFVTGPEKGAKLSNNIVVFANFYRKKRGYFEMHFELLTTEPRDFENGKLTALYVSHLEKAIRLKPANYLWSHRRWKWEFDIEKHGHRIVDREDTILAKP
jgi:KDO2-lipid IV(A) lauroyltransferase